MPRLFLLALLAGCAGGDPPTVSCEDAAIRDAQGDPDPCDVAACDACQDVCDEGCLVLESFPPQYVCDDNGESFTVYDACPDWRHPDFLPCTDTPLAIGAADPSPLGFSADDVLASIAAPMVAAAQWVAEEGRPDTVVTLTIAAAGDPVFHDREPVDTGSTGACLDSLEIPVTLTLRTDDGAFDEGIATALWVSDASAVSVGVALDWQALSGSFVFATLVPSAWDSVTLDLSTLLSAAPEGQIQVSAERSVGPDTGEGFVGPLLRWPPQ